MSVDFATFTSVVSHILDARLPVLTIEYQIEPSGAIYSLEKTDRAFVGLVDQQP